MSDEVRPKDLSDDPYPTNEMSAAPAHPDDGAGTMIGPYKLLQKVGKGGMGVVWMAEQREPVQRNVAIKVIKASMHGDQVLARFEAERQALAMMDHPNIAKVLDAGTVPVSPSERGAGEEGGRPYFVMELVKGVPFNKYCDQEKLTLEDRIELFIPVCNAVQHAHQKGVVHRDLKPSNVLIALYDGKPVPKVIDFGVAKALHQKLTERTMFTEVGQVVGTLEYMAPEQAELNDLDIDTRADIYSLGVMLYELLTGALPFSTKELQGEAFLGMLRLIKEVEPSKPSTKISTSTQLPSIAANRRLDPKSLRRMVRGDLDWIVMKCLEKERAMRYETANELGRELQRFLADEPVQAGPPSVGYRAKKFIRRNKGSVIAASLVFLALIAGIIGTSIGFVTAQQAAMDERTARLAAQESEEKEKIATQKALDAAKSEQAARADADKKAQQAVNEKQVAQAVRAFLQDKIIRPANPWEQANQARRLNLPVIHDISVREALDRAAKEFSPPEKIHNEFRHQPLVQAEILDTIGETYQSIGEHEKAITFARAAHKVREGALDPDDPAMLASTVNLMFVYIMAERLAEAAGEMSAALDRLERAMAVARSRNDAGKNVAVDPAEAATDAIIQTLRRRLDLKRFSLPLFQPGLPEALLVLRDLERALPRLERFADFAEARFGKATEKACFARMTVGFAKYGTGRTSEAIEIFEAVHTDGERILRPNDLLLLGLRWSLAIAYEEKGIKLEQSILLRIKIYESLKKETIGAEHPAIAACATSIALAYVKGKRVDLAVPYFEESLKLRKTHFSPGDPETMREMEFLALCYNHLGKLDKARELILDHLKQARAKAPAGSPALAEVLDSDALRLLTFKAYAESEPLLRECLAIRGKIDRDKWKAFNTKSMLGASLLGQKKYQDAEPLLKEGYAGMKAQEKTIPAGALPHIREALERLVQLYEATENAQEAERYRKELAQRKAAAKLPI